ncbi:MAG TPA: histidine phosphatase family protein [Lacisediminihabitans sp.]|uniref:histidine phosphatase family protein n=1 Tax=Lacisediminihabitans sp. TaxID=2787631 RepID=UPI002EDA2295
MRLLLIRHGQTPGNVRRELDTSFPGPGLTELGTRQAAAIPDALRDEPIDAIFASRLVRTGLTAEPLASDRGLDITVLDGLHEIEAGLLEKRSDEASVQRYLETAFSWGAGDLDVVMPGGTDGRAFFRRFDAGIEIVATTAGTAAVFSHGAAIRVWTAGRATNIPPVFAGRHELENTGVVELNGTPEDGWTLTSWAGLPVGGAELADAEAGDPTGGPLP